ncbi:MAG: ABC transporter permease [Neomegalonema sp.]|nr:ABC transporter permease [Neomegalonema sp.]
MLRFLIFRTLAMMGSLLLISALIFFIINLPEGDFISNQIAELKATGQENLIAEALFKQQLYSLDRPLWEQYLIWLGVAPGEGGYTGLLQGELGWSFELNKSVAEVIGDGLWLTLVVNLAAVLFVYAVALPLGVISAVKANSWVDYLAAFVGYIGLATPNFLLALILLYYGKQHLDLPIGGLMAAEFEGQPMSWDKMGSILTHLIVPTIVIGTAGTAAMSQRLRANMLDELNKPYVTTAKAKGASPIRRIVRYPLRMALNPFVADIGNLLPQLVSGSVLISVVMSLPTIGPILLDALKSQDHLLSGFILLFIAFLTLIGMLLSDLLLALLDPRIRTGARKR